MKKSELQKLIREEVQNMLALQRQLVKESLAINEIGDVPENEPVNQSTNRSYAVKKGRKEGDKDAPDIRYTFIADDSDPPIEYTVDLWNQDGYLRNEDNYLSVSFKADGSYVTVTNRNQQFKVMATVVKIIKDYLNNYPKISKISFLPVKERRGPDDPRGEDKRRVNLYMAYVKKQIPNAKVTIKGDRYIIDLPSKVSERK